MRDVVPPALIARGYDLQPELEAREPKITGKDVLNGIKTGFSKLFGFFFGRVREYTLEDDS